MGGCCAEIPSSPWVPWVPVQRVSDSLCVSVRLTWEVLPWHKLSCCAEVNFGHGDGGSAKGGAQGCQAACSMSWIPLQWFYMGAGEGLTYVSVTCRSSFENTGDK